MLIMLIPGNTMLDDPPPQISGLYALDIGSAW
jgi:hypothetical protein